jgi:hypothetical protein
MVRCVLLLLALAAPLPAAADATAEREIGYLLDFVSASGCTFVRNGKTHDSTEAADHLRLKYQRGRRYATSAENFIDRLASESSWSGKAYTVRCGDSLETSGRWLHRELANYRQAAARSL